MKQINKYVNGTLSELENEQMTARLLQAKFERETRDKWATMLVEEHRLHRKPQIRRTSRYRYLAIAASLVFLLVVGQLFYSSNRTLNAVELADTYLQNSKMTEFGGILRAGAAEDVPQWRKEANTAYAQDKYEEAARITQQIVATTAAEPQDFLLLGLSRLYMGDDVAAIDVLKAGQMSSQIFNTYQDEMNWFLSIAYLKAQQPEMARPILEQIVKEKRWNHTTAKEMLENL